MTRYLKCCLYLLPFLMLSMNFASKAMDNDNDGLRHRIAITQNFAALEDNRDAIASVTPSISAPSLVTEEPQTWTSYLASPVKRITQNTLRLVNFAVENPRTALLVGLCYLAPAVEAGCQCVCLMSNGEKYVLGSNYPSPGVCMNTCTNFHWQFYSCD